MLSGGAALALLALSPLAQAQSYPNKPVTMIVAFPAGVRKDLMGGVLDFAVVPLVGPVLGAIEGGQIKALAVASPQSIARLPKLPAARSTKGFEDYQFSIWIGIQASPKTPDAQMAAIHKAAYAGLANPDTRKSIEASGTVIAEPMSLAQLDSFCKKEAATGAAIAKSISLLAQ